MFAPSPQQAAILAKVDEAAENLLVVARAGCGKTTLIEMATARMAGKVAVVAYNKAIAAELSRRLGGMANVEANTFHSFGFRALKRAVPALRNKAPNFRKTESLLRATRCPEDLTSFVTKLVSLAKQRAVGVLDSGTSLPFYDIVEHFALYETLTGRTGYDEGDMVREGVDRAIAVMLLSLDELKKGNIDFDDMIYGPLALNVPLFQHDWIAVDEAQDTNPARRALARKLLKGDGLSLWVGDDKQAIYGFTGADNDAMDIVAREFNCVRMPLSVTYRCPKAVVAVANTWVPDISAADVAPAGRVDTITDAQFEKLGATLLTRDDAILCRLTKPLVETAYGLIRRGIACHIEGRDLAGGLVKLVEKVAAGKGRELNWFSDRLDEYETREVQRLLAKGQETQAEAIADRCATIRVFEEQLPISATTTDLIAAIRRLFEDTEEGERPKTLTLSTVHKAKGREWDRVYLLGRNKFMPSKWARQEWQQVQEVNLMYVAVTRAKRELVEVEL